MRTDVTKSAGFTLLEMMITLTVVAILMAVAIPGFRPLILNSRIKTTSFDVFSALNYTRSEALKRNTSVTLRAGASADGTWASGWRIVDPTNAAIALRSWGALSDLTLTEKNGGATTLTYGRDGRLTSSAPKLQISPASTVSGVTSRCIQVDLSGRPSTTTGACP